MKFRHAIAILLAAVMVIALPFLAVISVSSSTSENLGAIAECVVDKSAEKITIRGSLKHGVLVNNREAKLAVYRFDPWINVESAVKKATPLATMDMTIRFEFELSCSTIAHRLSLYAVAIISPDGAVSLVSSPCYPDRLTADTSDMGFKAVITDDVAGAVASYSGSAVIDVYLDKLDRGNKSGYIFNADGELFYFDREVIGELDKKVLAYTATGTNVFFRFLISPDAVDLPFATKGNLWATNKCVVIDDVDALKSVYAYTYFLVSRYDGEEYGLLSGIILGKGADKPVLYNYATLVSEDYETVYARSLSVIGIAALEAAGNENISLIVPIGDSLTDSGEVYALPFLESVSSYIDERTKLTFTVMCESRHNPYKLKDSFFSTEIDPDDTYEGEDGYFETESNGDETSSEFYENETDVTGRYSETEEIPETTNFDESTEASVTVESPETTDPPTTEPEKPQINTSADGYYCTDNIDVFTKAFKSLKKKYQSVNDGFAWCWYPGSDTGEGALSVCYAYNYVKLATIGADFYAVCFDDAVSGKFSSITHLYKYIDTAQGDTEYAKNVFGVSDWSEIIDDYHSGVEIFHDLREGDLEADVDNFIGSVAYFDYSTGRTASGWYGGLYCNSLGVQAENGESFLQALMDLDSAGVNQSEIGYIFDDPEPLMLGDAVSFDVKCGEDDGSLYEIAIHIRSGDITVVSKKVISGGVRSTLSLDVSECDRTNGVDSIKITLKRVTGSGSCNLNLYKMLVNSVTVSDDQLWEDLENIRDYLRADSTPSESGNGKLIYGGVVVLSAFGMVALLIAYINDRKNKSDEMNEAH